MLYRVLGDGVLHRILTSETSESSGRERSASNDSQEYFSAQSNPSSLNSSLEVGTKEVPHHDPSEVDYSGIVEDKFDDGDEPKTKDEDIESLISELVKLVNSQPHILLPQIAATLSISLQTSEQFQNMLTIAKKKNNIRSLIEIATVVMKYSVREPRLEIKKLVISK